MPRPAFCGTAAGLRRARFLPRRCTRARRGSRFARRSRAGLGAARRQRGRHPGDPTKLGRRGRRWFVVLAASFGLSTLRGRSVSIWTRRLPLKLAVGFTVSMFETSYPTQDGLVAHKSNRSGARSRRRLCANHFWACHPLRASLRKRLGPLTRPAERTRACLGPQERLTAQGERSSSLRTLTIGQLIPALTIPHKLRACFCVVDSVQDWWTPVGGYRVL